jgi:hypothetical protein
MKYVQGDIVLVNFLFPDGQFKEHFAIIVSNDELQADEGFFLFGLDFIEKHFSKIFLSIG